MSAEAKRIGDSDLQICLAGMVGDIVQIAEFVWLLQVDSGWNYAFLKLLSRAMASRPPAAPSVCPVIDLFAVTGIR
jgi:hypothetical protein